jgi:4-hydroxy-2-oxoheptanedioate aldolase
MRTNHVKEKLKRGEPVLGAWLNLSSVASARLMARLGFDWLVIDMEHSAHHAALTADMVATIVDAGTCAPIVRIPNNGVEWYKWALDAGAWGVVVPMVNTRQEAERAIECSKYPPLGTRSMGGAFAPYAFDAADWPTYARIANEQTLVIIQIESARALQNLDEILSVPGIDVAFVGPNDLHAQLGLTPSTEGAEPEFTKALERIKTTASKHQVATGIFSRDGEAAIARLQQGFHMISVTTDISSLLTAATQNLATARATKPRKEGINPVE